MLRTVHHRRFMMEALFLARRGLGRVEPNPMVGCVLVKAGRIVGRGFHHRYGAAHAEVHALRDAGRRAKGSTAYVNLEPCCHFGKTPPCTDALIAAGVRRVVVAIRDVNPQVAGNGLRILRAAGLRCDVGLLRDEAEALNAPFIKYFTERRPYVILKWAQSLDGKIATRSGDSRWISSAASRQEVHRLRARMDAIIVGVQTVIQDDPQLTARGVPILRVATRVVLDSQLRTPPTCRLVSGARRVPTLIVTSNKSIRRAGALRKAGCEVIRLPRTQSGLSLSALLDELHQRRMTNVLVEGGGRVLGSFVDEELADEARVFVAPRLIGGETAPGPLRTLGPETMRDLPKVMRREDVLLGPDRCYTIKFR